MTQRGYIGRLCVIANGIFRHFQEERAAKQYSAPLASKRTQLAVDDGKKDQKDTSEGKLYTNNSSTNF